MPDALYKWFIEHPQSVNETYLQHLKAASQFALRLLVASAMCMLHAFVPKMCERSASRTVTGLFDDMVTNRVQRPSDPYAAKSGERSDSALPST